VCGIEWETRGSIADAKHTKVHTCSEACKSIAHKNGGVIERQRAATCVERYGAENPFAAEPCKQKMRSTWKKKYGVEQGPSSIEVRTKAMQTMRANFGDHPQTHPDIVKKRQATMIKNWGVKYPMQLVHVREAMISGTIAKYGVPYHQMNAEHAAEVLHKRAREGTLFQSKPENAFYELLCEKFGEDDVERQVVMNKRWSIDFHIKSIDTYVQFDGVYWHGLDRPIELIRESGMSGHRRDMGIYRKWLVDRQQDAWFDAEGLRFIRITDAEFKNDPDA